MAQADKYRNEFLSEKVILTREILKMRYQENQISNLALHTFQQIYSEYPVHSKQKNHYLQVVSFSESQEYLQKFHTMNDIFERIQPAIIKELSKPKIRYNCCIWHDKFQGVFPRCPYILSKSSSGTRKIPKNNPEEYQNQKLKKITCGTEETNKYKRPELLTNINLLNDLQLNVPSSILMRNVLNDLAKMVEQLNHKSFSLWYRALGHKEKNQESPSKFEGYELGSLSSIRPKQISYKAQLGLTKQQDYGLGKIKEYQSKKKNSRHKKNTKKSTPKENSRSQLRKSQMRYSNTKCKIPLPLTPQPYYRIYYNYIDDLSDYQILKPACHSSDHRFQVRKKLSNKKRKISIAKSKPKSSQASEKVEKHASIHYLGQGTRVQAPKTKRSSIKLSNKNLHNAPKSPQIRKKQHN